MTTHNEADLATKTPEEVLARIAELDEVASDPHSDWDIAAGRREDPFCQCGLPDAVCEWDDAELLWEHFYLQLMAHQGVGLTL